MFALTFRKPGDRMARMTYQPLLVVTAVMKNEAENLEKLIASTEGVFDHWVVVDTGSTDGTQEKLKYLLGDELTLVQDDWDDDFARVRNLSLQAAEKLGAQWCFVLDGDDLLEGAPAFKRAIAQIPEEVHFCGIEVIAPRHDGGAERFVQPRLFRASEKIRYEYPVHAYPDLGRWWANGAEKRILQLPDCRVRHEGYKDKAHLQKNWERTVRILREKMPEVPGETRPQSKHRLYYEGRSLMCLQRWEEAHEVVAKLVDLHGPGDGGTYLSMLAKVEYHGKGDILEAVHLYAQSLEINPGNLDNWYALLRVVSQGLYQIGAGHLQLENPPPSSQLPHLPQTLRALTDAHLFSTTVEEMGLIEAKVAELFPQAG